MNRIRRIFKSENKINNLNNTREYIKHDPYLTRDQLRSILLKIDVEITMVNIKAYKMQREARKCPCHTEDVEEILKLMEEMRQILNHYY